MSHLNFLILLYSHPNNIKIYLIPMIILDNIRLSQLSVPSATTGPSQRSPSKDA